MFLKSHFRSTYQEPYIFFIYFDPVIDLSGNYPEGIKRQGQRLTNTHIYCMIHCNYNPPVRKKVESNYKQIIR